MRRLPALLLALSAVAAPLAAQIPYDSLPPDTLRRDTINTTERYLEGEGDTQVYLPAAPRIGPSGPDPAMSRIVLTRDSIQWAMAETVSDLLTRVPGLYLWRGGWLGRTEYPSYRYRGPASVEYFVDGLPYVPIGPDTLGVDPSYFSLSLYDHIEIEPWPGSLRVWLYTRRHERKAPASRIGIARGDKDLARYIAALEKRFESGIGFAMQGERMVVPTASGSSSAFDISNLWLQIGYVPNAHLGTQVQLLYSAPDRDPYVDAQSGTPDTLELGLRGTRNDAQFRAFWRQRTDDLGFKVDGLVGRTTWGGGGVKDEEVRQGGVVLGWRGPTAGVTARVFNRSRWTPWDVEASGRWNGLSRLTVGLDAAYQTHDLDRSSQWLGARVGASLPLGFEALATGRTGSVVSSPTVLTEQAQDLTDWQVQFGWERPRFGVEVGYGHTDGFTPQAFRSFTPTVPQLGKAGGTEWLTVGWRVALLKWITLQGWYSDPVGGESGQGVPPTHSLTSATIRSKFLRTFRSTVFDLKAQVAYETWGDGVIGLDPNGAPLALDGASFWRMEIEFSIDAFHFYWDRFNARASRKTYVPGFPVLNFGSTFGVRWEFLN
ncbi:MAG: hypothetical protein OEW80_11430 [Gemmatimonadota bacterium]|nr:hypothetical protein [Gemmatimonadota bacterium]